MPHDTIQVVCIGGGTGQSRLLQALARSPAFRVTAIVSMFDAGGSSGRLRDEDGVLPPSDLLRCAAALSPYPYVRDILTERIQQGSEPYHTGGNLLLAKLEKTYGRPGAVRALHQLFRIQGTVLPISYSDSNLCGQFRDGTVTQTEPEVDGGIAEGRIVASLSLLPDPVPNPDVLEALAQADVIVIGPGSFYTSLVPNLLVRDVSGAVSAARAPVVAVMNLLSEGVDTKDLPFSALLRTWEHGLMLGRGLDAVIANDLPIGTDAELARFRAEHKYPIFRGHDRDNRVIWRKLWSGAGLARHDPEVLARVLQIELSRLAAR